MLRFIFRVSPHFHLGVVRKRSKEDRRERGCWVKRAKRPARRKRKRWNRRNPPLLLLCLQKRLKMVDRIRLPPLRRTTTASLTLNCSQVWWVSRSGSCFERVSFLCTTSQSSWPCSETGLHHSLNVALGILAEGISFLELSATWCLLLYLGGGYQKKK